MQNLIKKFVREYLLEQAEKEAHVEKREDELLVEPDFSADTCDAEEKSEQSVVGGVGGMGSAIAGYTLPLGMKPKGQKRKPNGK